MSESSLWNRVMLEGPELARAAERVLGLGYLELPDMEKLIEQNRVYVQPPHRQHVHGGPNAGWTDFKCWTATVSASCRTYPNPHDPELPSCVGRGMGATLREAVLRAIVHSFGEEHPAKESRT